MNSTKGCTTGNVFIEGSNKVSAKVCNKKN